MTSKYKSQLETREAAEHRALMDRTEQLPGGREELLAVARKAIDGVVSENGPQSTLRRLQRS